MRYFRLVDDIYVPNRWHLGDVTCNGVDQKVALDYGQPLNATLVEVAVSRDGRPLDYCETSFGVPVAIDGLAMEMEAIAGADFQRVPAIIMEAGGYSVLNCGRRVKCLDESGSEFVKWLPTDHRADLAGKYKMVTRLIIDPTAVPKDAHFFRVWGWVALIVSETMKEAMEEAGCLGAKFLPV